ncbi:MAG TPA: PEP-CTERM sorting domain-containing protein [Burkholderiaceae bacterium]
MSSCSLLKPLIVGMLACAAWSSALAQPPKSWFESEDVTFSSASRGTSSAERGEDEDGSSHGTLPGGPHSNGIRLGAVDTVKLHGKHEPRVTVPVSAISEPPTLALLLAGLVGVVLVARRHRPNGR